MVNKTSLTNKLAKGFSKVDKVLGLFDTVAMVDKVSKNTAPILEKAIDRHYDRQKELIKLPDVRHLQLAEASAHLEDLGFLVTPVVAKPDQLKPHSVVGEVLAMIPQNGKHKAGSLIKLYYNDGHTATAQTETIDLPVLAGMMLDDALELLEKKGFTASKVIAEPRKDWANKTVGLVVDNDPKPSLLTKVGKQGTVIRVFYLTEEVIAQSQALIDKDKAQQEQLQQAISDSLGQAGKLVGDGIGQLGQLAGDVGKNLKGIFNHNSKP